MSYGHNVLYHMRDWLLQNLLDPWMKCHVTHWQYYCHIN